jgi:two-component system cell cycle sensor histidine kinase/response regulator CckA
MDNLPQKIRVLILEDTPSDAELMLRELHRGGFEPDWQRVETEADFLASLSPAPDLILSDYALPQFSGLKALQLVRERDLKIPFILISGTIGEETAVTAMREGAADYLLKDRLARLGEAVKRALAEKRLRDERKQSDDLALELADIIHRAHDAIIVRDFETDRVTTWNSGAEHLYGWSARETIGRPLAELIFAEPDARATLLESLIAAGEFHGELKHRTKDGREVIVDTRTTLIRNDEGTPRSVLGINTDITERKKLEMQLLRAQRLESIGTLASGVAHDLNNILAPILMGAEILRGTAVGDDAASVLDLIEQSARRGTAIVKQVLTFARGIEGERVLIQPSYLVQEMADIAQRTFPKSIEVRSQYADDIWSMEGDPTQLHQVLLNLAVNARDAMPNGGLLTIAVENFRVDEHYASLTPGAKAGPHVMFCVSDTGEGMPRGVIDKIFDPFFTTKEFGKGTGLGLSTTLGIVKSHGGFISVYSEVRRGTTFKIFLPAQPAEQTLVQPDMALESFKGNGESILVVDDEPAVLTLTRVLLEKHNYRVMTANDSPEALALFAQQMAGIDAVLTDITMPYMDGIALIRAAQQMKPNLKFVASTGQGEETRVEELRSLGVTNFLSKPYDTEKLLKTVRAALAGPSAEPHPSN